VRHASTSLRWLDVMIDVRARRDRGARARAPRSVVGVVVRSCFTRAPACVRARSRLSRTTTRRVCHSMRVRVCGHRAHTRDARTPTIDADVVARRRTNERPRTRDGVLRRTNSVHVVVLASEFLPCTCVIDLSRHRNARCRRTTTREGCNMGVGLARGA